MSRVPPSRRKARLIHPVERNADLAAFQDIPDVAAFGRFLDGAQNQRLGTAQEPLAVLQAFTTRIQAPIDDVHSHCCIPPQPTCFTRMYHSTSRPHLISDFGVVPFRLPFAAASS